MGGFFGAVSHRDIVYDVFFGTDYHSHLGTNHAGMTIWGSKQGFQRQIHSISDTPFRTKFEPDLADFEGSCGFGCISDSEPQPLLVRSHLGVYAITTVGLINNAEELIQSSFSDHGHQFMAMSNGKVNSTELVAAIINTRDTLAEGILRVQELVKGSVTLLLITENGELLASRDKLGRLPVIIGKNEDGFCATFESFAAEKVGYTFERELGPAEIVKITPVSLEVLSPAGKEMKICAFLWSYFGYPNANYEGQNVEVMRYKNGQIMARDEEKAGLLPDVDFVAGVPDSGIPHAIGYANESKKTFARPFIKYTPSWLRSFMPVKQKQRNQVAKMKQIPVPELIKGKKLLFVDDSIVRGTQLRETAKFLYEAGAKEVHLRSACPPIMHSCKYINFSRSNSELDLLARRIVQELEGDEGQKHLEEYSDGPSERGRCLLKSICEKLGFTSLEYQSLDGMLEAIGLDKDKVCTYCWTGKE